MGPSTALRSCLAAFRSGCLIGVSGPKYNAFAVSGGTASLKGKRVEETLAGDHDSNLPLRLVRSGRDADGVRRGFAQRVVRGAWAAVRGGAPRRQSGVQLRGKPDSTHSD